jgi:hypothetical protein
MPRNKDNNNKTQTDSNLATPQSKKNKQNHSLSPNNTLAPTPPEKQHLGPQVYLSPSPRPPSSPSQHSQESAQSNLSPTINMQLIFGDPPTSGSDDDDGPTREYAPEIGKNKENDAMDVGKKTINRFPGLKNPHAGDEGENVQNNDQAENIVKIARQNWNIKSDIEELKKGAHYSDNALMYLIGKNLEKNNNVVLHDVIISNPGYRDVLNKNIDNFITNDYENEKFFILPVFVREGHYAILIINKKTHETTKATYIDPDGKMFYCYSGDDKMYINCPNHIVEIFKNVNYPELHYSRTEFQHMETNGSHTFMTNNHYGAFVVKLAEGFANGTFILNDNRTVFNTKLKQEIPDCSEQESESLGVDFREDHLKILKKAYITQMKAEQTDTAHIATAKGKKRPREVEQNSDKNLNQGESNLMDIVAHDARDQSNSGVLMPPPTSRATAVSTEATIMQTGNNNAGERPAKRAKTTRAPDIASAKEKSDPRQGRFTSKLRKAQNKVREAQDTIRGDENSR